MFPEQFIGKCKNDKSLTIVRDLLLNGAPDYFIIDSLFM